MPFYFSPQLPHTTSREATFAATVWPEYAALNAVHLLAHHPDFPEEATLESPDACAEAMKNFKDMLVGMLEILSVNETIPPLARKLLRMGERLGDASASGSGLAAQKDAAFRLRLLAVEVAHAAAATHARHVGVCVSESVRESADNGFSHAVSTLSWCPPSFPCFACLMRS